MALLRTLSGYSFLSLLLASVSASPQWHQGQPDYSHTSGSSFQAGPPSSSATHAAPSSTQPASSSSSTAAHGEQSPSSINLSQCAASLNGQLPSPTPANFHWNGNVKRYYVAAEEIEWDYAPTGWDNWLGVPLNLSPRAQMSGQLVYGTTWLKALYRGYTDSSFSTYTSQPPWQGTQGPIIRAELGDLIEIMFVNKLPKYFATMHSMGLEYTKVSEGADYPNNTAPGENVILPAAEAVPPVDSGVAPGDCVVYKWMVDESAGPNAGEPARVHSYHSYVALQQDSNAGLIGPTIIYAPGKMNSTMASYREIPLLYMIYDESESWLSATNAAALQSKAQHSSPNGQSGSNGPSQSASGFGGGGFGPMDTTNLFSGNQSVWQPQVTNLAGAGQFQGASSYFTMNGYIFANNPTFEMCLNDKVIWYVNAYGSASHVFHLHGHSVSYNGAKAYAESINDGVGKTLYMNATGQGLWQAICHVDNHHALGMVSNYRVYGAGQCPLVPLSV